MKFPIEVLVIVGLSFVVQGCDTGPLIPENSTKAIRSTGEFDMWVVEPYVSQGQVLRLTDSRVRVELRMKDTPIPAVWLLYLHHGESAPLPSQEQGGRLAVLFSGTLDPMGSWPGNHIIVAGDKKGTRRGNNPTCGETIKSLPYRKASARHHDGRPGQVGSNTQDPRPLTKIYCANS